MIHARMAATPEVLACFDDAALVAAALRFERELAAALAEQGAIATEAAAAIARACEGFDARDLADAAALAGTLAIPIVERLRARVPPEHAAAVHRGATSQDLADTALALQIAAAMPLLDADLARLSTALADGARAHARLPEIGRTLLQRAEPITLGMRFATWMLGVDDARDRLAREAVRRVQLGGAVGSLASLGDRGTAVRASLAARLGLVDAPSWHARRGAIAGLGGALAIATGAIGKIARDVSLLMQPEIGELAEPRTPGRGGSSAMPHKHNPTGCQVALSAALRAPPLASTLMAAMPQELERGLGGWQAEAPVIAELFALASGAARAMREVAEGLAIDAAAIAAHVSADEAESEAAARFVDEALALHDARSA